MTIYLLALLIGIAAGLRAFAALAAVSVATCAGWLVPGGWPLLIGTHWVAGILTLLAIAEMLGGKYAAMPDRRSPLSLGIRMACGVIAGATIGSAAHMLAGGGLAGLAGAVAGTLAGSGVRAWLIRRLGRPLPAALVEDCAAIAMAVVAILSVQIDRQTRKLSEIGISACLRPSDFQSFPVKKPDLRSNSAMIRLGTHCSTRTGS
ncbi:DUF4126 family protein [Sphingomonas sp. KC8]|uniref:DUF4126 family protein n=1 Tax=Sphingomonas sp. KC8 TaxID=1030157 RepID=UPI000A31DF8D|nr:DUF4126 family protein [Sphingomonas sp. KC8]ARS27234.1 membrane protein [Sphingomonas sp. KC8]